LAAPDQTPELDQAMAKLALINEQRGQSRESRVDCGAWWMASARPTTSPWLGDALRFGRPGFVLGPALERCRQRSARCHLACQGPRPACVLDQRIKDSRLGYLQLSKLSTWRGGPTIGGPAQASYDKRDEEQRQIEKDSEAARRRLDRQYGEEEKNLFEVVAHESSRMAVEHAE